MTFWVAGAAVVGAGVSAYSSSQAAGAQADAAKQANQTQVGQYNQTRLDQLPWMNRGNAAGNRLNELLGLGGGNGGAYGMITKNDLVDTSGGDWRPNADLYANDTGYRQAWDKFYAGHQARFGVAPNLLRGSGLDVTQDDILRNGFDLDTYNKAKQTQTHQTQEGASGYGSLLRDITRSDIEADPVYSMGLDFGLSEGRKGLERQAAAGGGLLSGATLKALTKYGSDYATTKGGDAFNRITGQRQNKYNMLAGVAGTGQTAVNQVGTTGANTANNISANQIGIGNARGASAIATGNALSGAYGNYQTGQLYNKLLNQQQNGSYGYGTQRNLNGYDANANGGWGIE